jgi:hypothetical protein
VNEEAGRLVNISQVASERKNAPSWHG